MLIKKDSLAYKDFLDCKKALSGDPSILNLVFGNIKNPHRPVEYEVFIKEYNHLSLTEKIKVRIIYSIWNDSTEVSFRDLVFLDLKTRNKLCNFLKRNQRL